MKKLLTLIGAAAVSFGLYAVAVEPNGTGFESEEPGVPSGELPAAYNFSAADADTQGNPAYYWFANSFDDVAGTVTEYGSGEAYNVDAGDNYLALETGSDPLYRAAAPLAINEGTTNAQKVAIVNGVVFDQLVKFSAFDSDPTELDSTAKIAVWLKADEEGGETNLYVSTAVLGADLAPSYQTNLVLQGANVVPDSWHQLTITAIPAYNLGGSGYVPGFVVAVDGNALYTTETLYNGLAALDQYKTPGAAKLIAEKKLFPSRVAYNVDESQTGYTLRGVGYQGSGAIDSIDINVGNAFEATATITAPANATISSVASTNGYAIIDNGNGTYTVAKGDAIRVTLAPATGYHLGETTSQVFGVNDNTTIDTFSDIEVVRDSYAVTFWNGEAIVATTNVTGDTVALPQAAPEAATGKTFAGWFETNSVPAALFDFSTPITSALDLFAQFTNTLYDITLTAGENSTIESTKTNGCTYGEVVTITATANEGYVFEDDTYAGWTKVSDTVVTQAYTVVAGANAVKGPDAVAGIDQYTITLPAAAAHTTWYVETNGVEITGSAGVYTVDEGSNVKVYSNAEEGYLFPGGVSTKLVYDWAGISGDKDQSSDTPDAPSAGKAKIGTVIYLTLQDAVNAAGAGDKVELLASDTLSARLNVAAGQDITLDLGGYTLTSSGDAICNRGSIVITNGTITAAGNVAYNRGNGASMTIEDGTYTSTADIAFAVYGATNSTITVNGGTIKAQEFCVGIYHPARATTITINDGTLTSIDNAVVGTNGTAGDGDNVIYINGGTLNGGITTPGYVACGIYLPNNDTLVMTGGEINVTGGCGILARAGQVSVTGGEINTTGNVTGKVGDSRVVVPCSAIVFDTDANYPGYDSASAEFDVSGGTFSSEVDCVTQVNENGGDVAIAVSGGTFNTPIAGDYCAEGFVPADDGAGNYGVTYGYTITYVSEHGTAPAATNVTVATLSGAYTLLAADLPALAAENYTFNGWGKTAGETISDDTTLTASWTAVEYTLTYESAQGTAPAAVTYTIESNDFAFAAAPEVSGYEFLGWVIGTTTNAAGATYVVADHLANTTATAAWKENAPVGPTVDGKTVDPSEVFDTATSTKPITYTTAPTLSGEEGSQTITWGGKTVDVPTYYTASLEGTTVTLELNSNAVPEIGATSSDPAMEVSSTTVSVGLATTNPKLYYGLSSCSTVGGTYAAPASVTQGTGSAMSLSIDRGTGETTKFYKVYVTDVAP